MVVLPETEPSISGSNFVDIGLKVVIQQSTGTAMAFKLEHLYPGTTVSRGLANLILAVTFSCHVSDVWTEAAACEGKPIIAYKKVDDVG